MNKDIIVLYCAVLKTTLIKQTLMSLRSLREHCCVPYEIPVVIITDQKSLFLSIAQLTSSTLKNVIFWEVTSEEAYKWMGTNQYVFNIKIKAIMACCERYAKTVIFVDCDTYFYGDICQLFSVLDNTHVVMYCRTSAPIGELYMQELDFQQQRRLYREGNYFTTKNSTFHIDISYFHYNSGMIGLPIAQQNLLPKVLELANAIYYEFAFPLSEELAFSCIYQQYLVTAQDVVFHYCFAKKNILLLAYLYGMLNKIEEKKFVHWLIYNNIDYSELQNVNFCSDDFIVLAYFFDIIQCRYSPFRDLIYWGEKGYFRECFMDLDHKGRAREIYSFFNKIKK